MKRAAASTLVAVVAIGATAATIGMLAQACGVPDAIVARENPVCIAAGNPCQTSLDCCDEDGGAGYFCSKGECDAGMGTCQPRTTNCDSNGGGQSPPVCSCSGVWYLNDCLRKEHGESAISQNSCPPRPCSFDDAGACPQGTHCFLNYGPDCQPLSNPRVSQSSQCWALPETCPTHPTNDPFTVTSLIKAVSCAPSTTANPCEDLCSALKKDAPVSLVGMCQ
jgi:hypothetical protein